MSKWFVNCVTDLLIVFALATLLLFYVAVTHPEFFPQRFFQYWVVAKPESVSTVPAQISVVTQVQP
ncbi:MAG: hypothetical protein QJT81_06700 [Candidatus Thiothrix putei]|uniref:Uncharacterized protein n=1 Tax=Candidatus Thiothrix putei TaxID=3080811 RepID=A0AA95KPA9_9GAMM|nr:MAG: hypothetical protein QJT81_06700 [Candidatus Thiothrix putei]